MPHEIKRVKLSKIICTTCKAAVMDKPTDKVCPVCGSTLPTPAE